ncbi:MAG: glycosyltransferase family 2 protein [Phreatobacter sp.]|uniref:glycosyltransferase family 2 protein n=1 Tax=Phreatobacter sp. TaxID=1966341 RepID=UPI00273286F6|nr:glycosyltransferase family 2 protein [Phreatobacter sp.]MDP2803115.1 glycosyltransferase family 2 protein [Phreatobacter sp.]
MRLDEFRTRFAERSVARPAAAPPTAVRHAPVAGPRPRLVDELVDPLHRVRVAYIAGLWNVPPLETALALGLTTAEAIAAALAVRLGGTVEPLDGAHPTVAADPQSWRRVLARGAVGVSRPVGGRALLIAPGPAEAERLAADAGPAADGLPLLVATPQAFARLVRAWAEVPWVGEAVSTLAVEEPALSASDRVLMRRMAMAVVVMLVALFLALTVGPAWLALAAGGMVGLLVAAWVLLRVAAATIPPLALPRTPLGEAALPRYTILCALYREEAVAEGLLASLARLDYPRAKLDIKLVLEADDPDTLAAIRRAAPDATVEVIVVPALGPRTKPKALMMALPFATGDVIVVYDAEDRPGRGQLREAAETFAVADARLGCLQAPLAIVNPGDSLLARFYAAEYDALFRVLLPALARFHLPMPLGGTSNHFRRVALDQSLGWDPYNVTEDADLGFRLARNGWRIGTIATPTLEEAPVTFGDWLRQRSRWFKGWMQTLAILARDPRRLGREIGLAGLLVLAATLAGALGSALVHLTCLAAFVVTWLIHGLPSWAGAGAAVFLLGYAGSVVYKVVGLVRAGRPGLLPWLVLLPLVWIAMGLAALKAVGDLWFRPFHWEKTPHGAGSWPEAVADAPVAPGPPEALERIVALSEAVMASGRHSPHDVAAALRRQCRRWQREGTAPALLAVVEAYGREVEGRRRPG